jgi:hypothetical protein
MTLKQELKPCLFCGNAEGREPEKYGVYVWQERRFRGDQTKGAWTAECRNCGASLPGWDTEEAACQYWNERNADAFDDLVAALKSALPKIIDTPTINQIRAALRKAGRE